MVLKHMCFCHRYDTVAQRLTSIHSEILRSNNFQLDLMFSTNFSPSNKLDLTSTNLPLSKRVRSWSVCQLFRSRWPAPHTRASTTSPSDTLLCIHDVGRTVLEDTGGGNGVCVCVCVCVCVHVSSITSYVLYVIN